MIARIGRGALPGVRLVYHHPGRLRLRGEVLVQRAGAVDRMRDALSGIEGVRRVIHNATSGSLLVEYAPERIDVDVILSAMAHAGVRLDETPQRRREASRVVVDAARVLDAQVGEATGGGADLHGVVSFALGVGAITSLVLGRQPRLPRWDNLLYWSYTFFRDVHLRDVERSVRKPPRPSGGTR